MAYLSALTLALALSPADDLLRLVPPDTAVCVVVRDLRGTTARLAASPFVRWLADSKLLDPFVPPSERAKLHEAEAYLTGKLGSSPQQLIDDVFGDAMVLAYRPGPPGKPQDESGVVLLHARDPARLATVVDKLNALQTESGELKSVTDRGRYLARTKADGGTEFVFRDGPVLAFSGQEAVLKEVIDRRATTPTAVSPVADSLRKLGLTDAAAVAWFHPSAFAAELKGHTDPGSVQAAKVWAACDGLAVSVRLTEKLEVGLTAAIDPARLPASAKAVLFPAAGGSAWGAVPKSAFVAVGGRLDVPALLNAADGFLPPGQTATAGLTETLGPLVGKGNVVAVLGGIGPEWVAWAEPPDAGWLPDWTVAIKLSPAATKPVLGALDLGASLVRLAYNRDHDTPLELEQSTRNGRTAKYLIGGLPQRTSYGVTDGFLVIASSPDRVLDFKPGDRVTDAPLARVDATRLRQYLVDNRDRITRGLSAQNSRPEAELATELDGLANVLRAVNRLELRHTAGDGLIRLTLEVEPVKSLK